MILFLADDRDDAIQNGHCYDDDTYEGFVCVFHVLVLSWINS